MILEAMYNGEFYPCETVVPTSPEYRKAVIACEKLMEQLSQRLSKEDYEQFKEQGAVGDVLLKFLDKDGKSTAFHEFNERVMGLSDEGLMNIENRIGIAVGEEKSKAILGVIRAKKIDILITDISCVKQLLLLMEEEGSSCQTI